MSEQHHVRWLRRQIPGLVSEGVLPDAVAGALLSRFPEPEANELDGSHSKESRGRRLATVAVGILAAALVGSGVILLLAHNWDGLSRPARTLVALAPLIASQFLALWVVLRDKTAGWRESTGVLCTFAIGAALALIEQTYHLGGEPEGLMLRWTLLSLPLCYVLRSTAVGVLCAIGITAWAPMAFEVAGNGRSNWSVVLLLALLPFAVWKVREARGSVGTTVLGWVLPVAMGTVLFCSLLGLPMSWIIFGVAAIFSSFIVIDSLWSDRSFGILRRPWLVAGRLSIVFLLIGLSFDGPLNLIDSIDDASVGELLKLAGPILFALAAFAAAWKRRAQLAAEIPWLAVPVILFVAMLIGEVAGQTVNLLLINLLLLALGVSGIARGFNRDSLVQLNFGMGVLTLQAVVRFFDSGIDFSVRGIAFIVVGLMFFFLNAALVRRRGAV